MFGFTTQQGLEKRRLQHHASPGEKNSQSVSVLWRKFNIVLRQKFDNDTPFKSSLKFSQPSENAAFQTLSSSEIVQGPHPDPDRDSELRRYYDDFSIKDIILTNEA
jgi:hypothetical protein